MTDPQVHVGLVYITIALGFEYLRFSIDAYSYGFVMVKVIEMMGINWQCSGQLIASL